MSKRKRYTLEGVAVMLEGARWEVKTTEAAGGVVRQYLAKDGELVCAFQVQAGKAALLVGDGTVLAPLMVRALDRSKT